MDYVIVTFEVINGSWPGDSETVSAYHHGLWSHVHSLDHERECSTSTLRSFFSKITFLWLRSCGGTLPRWWQRLQSLSSMVSTTLWHSQTCSEICLIFSRSWCIYWVATRCLDETSESKSNPVQSKIPFLLLWMKLRLSSFCFSIYLVFVIKMVNTKALLNLAT